jgi:hypothetical protein
MPDLTPVEEILWRRIDEIEERMAFPPELMAKLKDRVSVEGIPLEEARRDIACRRALQRLVARIDEDPVDRLYYDEELEEARIALNLTSTPP